MTKRPPFPPELLKRQDVLMAEYRSLPNGERERIRLATLKSGRYPIHEMTVQLGGEK